MTNDNRRERATASEPRERSGDRRGPASARAAGSGGAKPPGRDTDRVDELRQHLRALGYLDAGVDRFVLAPARAERSPIGVAAGASVRVSLLAAVLLGPAAAVGLAGRLPGLVSGVRDAMVLAVYLSVLFLIGAAALAFIFTGATALLVRPGATFARRARLVSSAAGWIATIGCLAYLTFWWRNANAGFGWSAPVWTTFALVVAVLISLLLGHAVRIAALGVAAARDATRDRLPAVRARSWRVTVIAGAIAFAGCAAVLVLTTSAATPDARSALTVVPTGYRVRLVAIDGFDLATYRQRATPGSALGGMLSGNHVHLAPNDTSDPARAWTTIATGVPPEVHGVRSIETTRVAGLRGILNFGDAGVGRIVRAGTDLVRLTSPSIASREERRAKTMWEVAAEAGLRTAVVNWWASWPAPAGTGIVITDRGPLRLEHGGALDAEIAPADLYGPLREAWPAIRQRAAAAAAAAFQGTTDTDTILRRSAELDATVIGLLEALPPPARDLEVVYLPGLDIAQHALLAASGGGAPSPSALTARVAAMGTYYAFLEHAVDPLIRDQPGLIAVVVTQPGRVATPAAGMLAARLRGVNIDYDERVPANHTVLDIMPTILTTLGVPVSRELRGTPLTRELLGVDFAKTFPARYVDSYGKPFVGAAARTGKPLDQEMIDRLRSLGYVR